MAIILAKNLRRKGVFLTLASKINVKNKTGIAEPVARQQFEDIRAFQKDQSKACIRRGLCPVATMTIGQWINVQGEGTCMSDHLSNSAGLYTSFYHP